MARASAQNSTSSAVEIISAAHKEIEPPANVDLAEQVLAQAQFNLGVMYHTGQGFAQNYKEGFFEKG